MRYVVMATMTDGREVARSEHETREAAEAAAISYRADCQEATCEHFRVVAAEEQL